MELDMTNKTTLLISVFLFTAFLSSKAQDNKDLSSELETYKITTTNNGNEKAVETSETQPGDTIEYRLTYTNNTSSDISNLKPTLPVPDGVKYVADSANPELSKTSLSTTGKNFKKLPIIREETNARGETVKREVPANEYRRLQWTVSSLKGGDSVKLSARVKVNDVNNSSL